MRKSGLSSEFVQTICCTRPGADRLVGCLGFPWLTRAVGVTGISLPDAGLLISWLATGAALFLVWFGWGRDIRQGRAFVLLMLFGLFPGSVYSFAVLPDLTRPGLQSSAHSWLRCGRGFFTAAVLMSLAGLCYPSAWFAAAGLAVGLVLAALSLGLGRADPTDALGYRRAVLAPRARDPRPACFRAFQRLFRHGLGTGPSRSRVPRRGLSQARLHAPHKRAEAPGAIRRRRVGRPGCGGLGAGGRGGGLRGRAEQEAASGPALPCVGRRRSGHRHHGGHAANGGAWNRSVLLAAPCVVCLRGMPLPVLCVLLVVVGATSAVISQYFFNYRVDLRSGRSTSLRSGTRRCADRAASGGWSGPPAPETIAPLFLDCLDSSAERDRSNPSRATVGRMSGWSQTPPGSEMWMPSAHRTVTPSITDWNVPLRIEQLVQVDQRDHVGSGRSATLRQDPVELGHPCADCSRDSWTPSGDSGGSRYGMVKSTTLAPSARKMLTAWSISSSRWASHAGWPMWTTVPLSM